jgi:hypothetical protein
MVEENHSLSQKACHHPHFIHHEGSEAPLMMNQIMEIGKPFLAKGDRLLISM